MSELSLGTLSGLAANSYVIDVASGSSLDLSAGAVLPTGSILQVVSTTKIDTFSTSSTSFTDVTGLSATITPTATSSKILVFYSVSAAHGTDAFVFPFNLVRDSTNIAQSTGGSTRNQTGLHVDSDNFAIDTLSGNFLDSPATTSSTTYKMQCRVLGGTGYVNRAGSNSNDGAVSTITVMEIAG